MAKFKWLLLIILSILPLLIFYGVIPLELIRFLAPALFGGGAVYFGYMLIAKQMVIEQKLREMECNREDHTS